MQDTERHIANELLETLAHIYREVRQHEQLLDAFLQALKRQGLQPRVDFKQAISSIRRELGAAQEQSQQVVEQLEQLQELVRTSAFITSSLELKQVLEDVMDTVVNLTGAERAYLMLREEESDELKIRAARNWEQESLSAGEVSFSHSVVSLALDKGEPVITTNAQTDARFEGRESVVVQGLRSILCIPLTLRGQVVGVLYADNRIQQGVFAQSMVPLLTAFGTQAAIAIDNARHFEAVRENLKEAQRELQRLRIELDRTRLTEKVDEITGTAYFKKLSATARAMRKRHTGSEAQEQQDSTED